MHGDSESQVPHPKGPDLWRLPPLQFVEIVRVRYQRPRVHTLGGKSIKREEGVEILLHTEEPIPVRALSPALFIGDQEVRENEAIGPSDYRFFVLDDQKLKRGAPIRLGWVGLPPPEEKRKARGPTFRYEPPTREVTELSLRLRRD